MPSHRLTAPEESKRRCTLSCDTGHYIEKNTKGQILSLSKDVNSLEVSCGQHVVICSITVLGSDNLAEHRQIMFPFIMHLNAEKSIF